MQSFAASPIVHSSASGASPSPASLQDRVDDALSKPQLLSARVTDSLVAKVRVTLRSFF